MPNVDEIAKKIREANLRDDTPPPEDEKSPFMGILRKGLPSADLLDKYIYKIRKGMVNNKGTINNKGTVNKNENR
jgi:hypothetical protein